MYITKTRDMFEMNHNSMMMCKEMCNGMCLCMCGCMPENRICLSRLL